MKVLQISKFYAPIRGGIEAVAQELTEGLNRAGVRADVLCSNQSLRKSSEQFAAGYTVHRAASIGMFMSTSMAPSMIRHLCEMGSEYDVLHVHMPDPMSALALLMARPRRAVVVHWHSDVIRQRLALKVYEPLQRWILNRADAVIATSEAYAESSGPLQAWRNKVCVIPIGISPPGEADQASADKVEALRKRFGGRRIVFALGRMTYYKGFDVLIEAAARLPDDCVVLIGGDGPLHSHYSSMVAGRGLTGKVCMLGHIHGADLQSHFAACDVFCLPSTARAEAYGVAMVEAMAAGKPVVASNIAGSGMPWVNVDGRTGFNVPVRQPGALADALLSLLDNTARREQFGAAARQRYTDQFSAELMTQRTLALYHRLPVLTA
jgi:glycosyltransferase involved in cell wall biosynthesis